MRTVTRLYKAKYIQWNLKPLKSIYNPTDVHAPASMKQKNLIIILCERRKITPPDLSKMTKGQASTLISQMLNS